jgi:hypothetical protein
MFIYIYTYVYVYIYIYVYTYIYIYIYGMICTLITSCTAFFSTHNNSTDLEISDDTCPAVN